MGKLWAFIPAPLRLWAALGAFLAIAGAMYAIYYKIDQGGYNRAVAEIEAANAKRAREARADIIKTGAAYEKIREDLRAQGGFDRPVSPSVGLAIDRMPETK